MLTLGGALATEGDIHRVLGNFAEAETSYEQANEQGCQPQPGLALLRLVQGRVDVASAMMRRVLAESQDSVSRSNHLPAAVEIALAAGDVDGARAAAAELGGIATELGMPLLRARAGRAHGAVLIADGDAAAALPELRAAFTTCIAIGARHEAARVRLLLADACRSLGDIETAGVEEATARAALASFLGADEAIASAAPDGLTDREAEVLRLLAQGHTNRVIAGQLFISEKTVASHVSHIFTKIGVTSRAGATAYAYERGLAI
jgi:DNA-binding NarL/FixJ family response regulator